MLTLLPYTTLFRSTVVLPASDGNCPTGSYAPSAGAPPVDGKATGPIDAPLVDLSSVLGSSVYAFNAAFEQYTIFDLDVPEVLPNIRSEEHTSELQSRENLVCRLLLEKKKRLHLTTRSGLHISEPIVI